MTKPEMTCPECHGSHITMLEFGRYRSGSVSTAVVGPGLMGVTEKTLLIVCLCGGVFTTDETASQFPVGGLQESYARARDYRRSFEEERMRSWAEAMIDASVLEKQTEDILRLEQLAQFASRKPPKV